jgi:hypothetical protein
MLDGYLLDIHGENPLHVPAPLIIGYPPHEIRGHNRPSILVLGGSNIRGYPDPCLKFPSLREMHSWVPLDGLTQK